MCRASADLQMALKTIFPNKFSATSATRKLPISSVYASNMAIHVFGPPSFVRAKLAAGDPAITAEVASDRTTLFFWRLVAFPTNPNANLASFLSCGLHSRQAIAKRWVNDFCWRRYEACFELTTLDRPYRIIVGNHRSQCCCGNGNLSWDHGYRIVPIR